jgi:hypothetical protein
MITVSFSIPEEVKNAFNEIFEDKNQNVIISDLMKLAVEEEHKKRQRIRTIDALLALRESIPPITESEMKTARQEGRP